MRHHALSAAAFALAGTLLVPAVAFAQLTTTTGPSVRQGPQPVPDRFLNYGQSNQLTLGTQTRSNGLNPTGVNYSDCISDMTLGFPVILSGFGTGNADGMQIWASVSGTCTTDSNRGNGAVPTCWLVNNGLPPGSVFTGSTEFFIRVQDIVGPQQAPPNPPVLVNEGASACSAQPSFAAVNITLWFVPLSGPATGDTNATALQWVLNTDLVGPPAPLGLTVVAGQALVIADWTANTDSDTLGYDVFIDPPPGSLAQQAAATQGVCPPLPGASSTVQGSSGATYASGAGASGDAADEPDVPQAGDAGATPALAGIATVPCQYAVGVGCPSGSPVFGESSQITVTGEMNTTFAIPGLIAGLTYDVAVSAVDHSGNPGPPSTPACNYPAAVNDAFDPGGAGEPAGGGCAVQGGTKLAASSDSPIGTWIGLGTAGIAVVAAGRRRRRR